MIYKRKDNSPAHIRYFEWDGKNKRTYDRNGEWSVWQHHPVLNDSDYMYTPCGELTIEECLFIDSL